MPRAAGDWFELVHGLGVVDPACGGARDLRGSGGTEAGRKKALESLFWRAGAVLLLCLPPETSTALGTQ